VAVVDSASIDNSIRGDSILGNAKLGIDLGGDGVTPNHSGSVAGPNHFQNHPVLATAGSGSSTRVVGSLNSLANSTFTLDFYANASADPSGFGQGQYYLGSATVTTDASGHATFDTTLATATDGSGNTSEFAADVTALVPVTPTMTVTDAGGVYNGNPFPVTAAAVREPATSL
jgi:hypothetical protein